MNLESAPIRRHRPLELTVELQPRSRFDVIDVPGQITTRLGDVLAPYDQVLYCSHHTTAGYLEQPLASRLGHERSRLHPFMRAFQRLFPYGAGYRHDEMELRDELSEEQRRVEPANADAHLAFIGAGLQSCVTYVHHPGTPVFLMDLDGECDGRFRKRITSVVGFNERETVAEATCDVPVSRHTIDSVNLSDERLGVTDAIRQMLREEPVEHGRLDIAIDPGEESAAVTVNEYETLLMRHDLADVLRDPLRFAARQGRRMLRDPRAVPAKSLGYAKYDVVQVLNELIDAFGLHESAVERLLARVMAVPAARFLRVRRSVSFAVSSGSDGTPRVVHGRYQSPILIQWKAAPDRARRLHLTLHRLS